MLLVQLSSDGLRPNPSSGECYARFTQRRKEKRKNAKNKMPWFGFLCAISVFSVPLWLTIRIKTTELREKA
jgi:hypothetical protein